MQSLMSTSPTKSNIPSKISYLASSGTATKTKLSSRMTDFDLIIKGLRLSWNPRLFTSEQTEKHKMASRFASVTVKQIISINEAAVPKRTKMATKFG